jgi:hypothetical protein
MRSDGFPEVSANRRSVKGAVRPPNFIPSAS